MDKNTVAPQEVTSNRTGGALKVRPLNSVSRHALLKASRLLLLLLLLLEEETLNHLACDLYLWQSFVPVEQRASEGGGGYFRFWDCAAFQHGAQRSGVGPGAPRLSAPLLSGPLEDFLDLS